MAHQLHRQLAAPRSVSRAQMQKTHTYAWPTRSADGRLNGPPSQIWMEADPRQEHRQLQGVFDRWVRLSFLYRGCTANVLRLRALRYPILPELWDGLPCGTDMRAGPGSQTIGWAPGQGRQHQQHAPKGRWLARRMGKTIWWKIVCEVQVLGRQEPRVQPYDLQVWIPVLYRVWS